MSLKQLILLALACTPLIQAENAQFQAFRAQYAEAQDLNFLDRYSLEEIDAFLEQYSTSLESLLNGLTDTELSTKMVRITRKIQRKAPELHERYTLLDPEDKMRHYIKNDLGQTDAEQSYDIIGILNIKRVGLERCISGIKNIRTALNKLRINRVYMSIEREQKITLIE